MKPFISFCLLLCICLGKLYAQGVNIVYIGNSITQGALLKTPVTEAPPVQASQYIEQATKQSVAFRNCGVSGTTTLDFLPIAERQFPNVKSAAQELSQRKGTLLFSIMLGTNDSACNGPFGSPVEPVSYYTNMKAIIDELLSLYPECKVVIHQPIWYSPNTYNGAMYLTTIHRQPPIKSFGEIRLLPISSGTIIRVISRRRMEMQVLFICTRIKREPVSWVNTGQRLS